MLPLGLPPSKSTPDLPLLTGSAKAELLDGAVKGRAVHAVIRARAAAQKWLASNERLYDMAKSLKRRLADARVPA